MDDSKATGAWTDGTFLIAQNGALLPKRCVVCNAAGPLSQHTNDYSTNSTPLAVGIIGGHLAGALLATQHSQQARRITFFVCLPHSRVHRFFIKICPILVFLATAAALAANIAHRQLDQSVMMITIIVGALVGLLSGAAWFYGANNNPWLQLQGSEGPIMVLRGPCKEFLDSLETVPTESANWRPYSQSFASLQSSR
jgi:hypothetical protein